MLVVGIAGGIASGKSYVAEEFQKQGAIVIDADKLGHQVLLQESIKRKIAQVFGEKVLNSRGEIDRKHLAAIVFGANRNAHVQLERLEAITHPEISALIQQQLEHFRASGCKLLILDAAVMFKSGWDKFCDRIVFVECDLDTRMARADKRGWTQAEFLRRESSQMSIEEKKKKSTDLIDNGSRAVVPISEQVAGLISEWIGDVDNYRISEGG